MACPPTREHRERSETYSIRNSAPPSCGFPGRPKEAWPGLPTEDDSALWSDPQRLARGDPPKVLGGLLHSFREGNPPAVSFMSFPGWMQAPAILTVLRGDPWCHPKRLYSPMGPQSLLLTPTLSLPCHSVQRAERLKSLTPVPPSGGSPFSLWQARSPPPGDISEPTPPASQLCGGSLPVPSVSSCCDITSWCCESLGNRA